jgi:hypothetical protein
LKRIKQCAAVDFNDGTWFHFEKEVDLKTQGEYGGIRLEFRAGIGEALKDLRRAQIIQLDLGIGDPVVPAPIYSKMPELLGNTQISWNVYPIETMIAEKLHALIDRGSDNSRSKDIFDLYLFLPKVNSTQLDKAIRACFEYRKTSVPKNMVDELKRIDLALIKKGWFSAIAGIPNAPSCDDCFNSMIKELQSKNQIVKGE